MNRLPVRLDIIREEDLDIPGFEQLREYVENTELKERPFSRNTMEDITSYGRFVPRDMSWRKSAWKSSAKARRTLQMVSERTICKYHVQYIRPGT